jgi:hyperosmotically inducible protein
VRTLAVLVGGLALFAQVAFADTERKDAALLNDISHAVFRYDRFTIFDDVSVSVENGIVTLQGRVTMPLKRDDIEKRVSRVDGIKQVVNLLAVLPVSKNDDELRYRIARTIYGNPSFWGYATMASPPIHIIVEHGHVTLTGFVKNDVDKVLARWLATQPGVLSVTNNLKTDRESREQLESS